MTPINAKSFRTEKRVRDCAINAKPHHVKCRQPSLYFGLTNDVFHLQLLLTYACLLEEPYQRMKLK